MTIQLVSTCDDYMWDTMNIIILYIYICRIIIDNTIQNMDTIIIYCYCCYIITIYVGSLVIILSRVMG